MAISGFLPINSTNLTRVFTQMKSAIYPIAMPLTYKLDPFVERFKSNNFNVYAKKLRDRPLPDKIKKIAVMSVLKIGDSLIMMPVLQALKKKMPRVQLEFMVKQEHEALFRELPFIDKLHVIQGVKHFESISAKWNILKNDEFDVILFPSCPARLKWREYLPTLKHSVIIAGIDYWTYKFCSGLDYMVYSEDKQGNLPYVAELGGLLPLSVLFKDAEWYKDSGIEIRPAISRTIISEKFSDISKSIRRASKGKKTVFFNPVASDTARILSEGQNADLLGSIIKDHPDVHLVVNGGTESPIWNFGYNAKGLTCFQHSTERQYVERILGLLGDDKNITLLPPLSIIELVNVMYRSSQIITVDTGVAHIAYSDVFRNIPVLSIYSSLGIKTRWASRGDNITSIVVANEHRKSPVTTFIPFQMNLNEVERKVDMFLNEGADNEH